MSRSMTGFGTAEREIDGVSFSVDIKTVNNRYLKISTRIDEALQAISPLAEDMVKKKIRRGTVTITIRTRLGSDRKCQTLNSTVLRGYIDQLKSLDMGDDPMLQIDIASLLHLPGVFESTGLELTEQMTDFLAGLIGDVLDDVIGMRNKEGQVIVDDLNSNTEIIRDCLNQIQSRIDGVVQRYHQRLKERIAEFSGLTEVEVDGDTLAREVAFYAERCDIAEEISRLSSHLKEFDSTCTLGEPVGRKLDFIAQEMLREANTIASKANCEEISRMVVDIKTAVDRIKEQAANLE